MSVGSIIDYASASSKQCVSRLRDINTGGIVKRNKAPATYTRLGVVISIGLIGQSAKVSHIVSF